MVRNRDRFIRRLLAASKDRRALLSTKKSNQHPNLVMPTYLDDVPKNAYVAVIDHSGDMPYGVASYQTLTAGKTAVIGKGFPRAAQPIQEWIPGVSTPEGIILTSSAALGLTLMLTPDLFERVLSGAATVVFVGVSTGIPAAAVCIGANLTGH